MASKLCWIRMAYLTASLSFLGSVAQAQDALGVADASAHPSVVPHNIQFAHDRLTVNVKDVSVRGLLEEIARQSDLTLVLHGSLQARITVEFHQLPLDRALRRILRHRNFALEYAENKGKESKSVPRPTGLWVFANGEGSYLARTTVLEETKARSSQPAVALDSGVVQAALESPDPEERENAVETLGESGHPEAITTLSLALGDENEDVREAAIDALADIGGEEAAQALAIALQDEDAELREDAVEALREIGGETAIHLLEQALQDNDKFVRHTAAKLLVRMRNEIY